MKNVRRRTAMLFIIACLTMMLSATTVFAASPYLKPKSKTLFMNQTLTIQVLKRGNNTVRSWKSSKPSVVRVNQHGKIRALRKGTAKITVKVGKKTLTCTVKVVVRKVKAIKLSKSQAKLQLGKTLKLSAKIAPANASIKNVKWKSSNTKIAVVTSKGEVVPKKTGTVTISATTKDGTKKTAKCKVTVVKKDPFVEITDVTVDIDNSTITAGYTAQATATITPSNATSKTVIWTSSNSSVATVNASGVVKGVKQGVATIKAEATDGSGEWDSIRISVIDDVLAPYRKGLAAAKKQGPAAVIKYCEQNRKKIDIGKYGNRGTGFFTVDSISLNAEADYGNALESLYKPWRNQIFTRSLASKTGDPYEQAFMTCMYINGMYFSNMVYSPRTVGWGLCPAIAPQLVEGMQTNLSGSGCILQSSYLGGNCTSVANLLIDVLRDRGIDCKLQNDVPGSFHVGVRVKLDSGSHKGQVFIFDPMFGVVYTPNLEVVYDEDMYSRFYQLEANYGPINYNP